MNYSNGLPIGGYHFIGSLMSAFHLQSVQIREVLQGLTPLIECFRNEFVDHALKYHGRISVLGKQASLSMSYLVSGHRATCSAAVAVVKHGHHGPPAFTTGRYGFSML